MRLVPRCRLMVLLLSGALGMPMETNADEALLEAETKAGFVFNFAKYTSWPPSFSSPEFVICAMSAAPLQGQLVKLEQRSIRGLAVKVKVGIRAREVGACHVLLIDSEDRSAIGDALAGARGFPVLTVGDSPGFVVAGGIIGMKQRAGRIRFDIDQGAARRAGLMISSHVLNLADEVLQ